MPHKPQQFHPIPSHVRAAQRQQYEQQRGTSGERGYNYRWQQASKLYLKSHPYCLHCEARGHVELGSKVNQLCVDHVIPHKGDQQLFWDQGNWQTLCKRCHDRKTAEHDGSLGRPPRPAQRHPGAGNGPFGGGGPGIVAAPPD